MQYRLEHSAFKQHIGTPRIGNVDVFGIIAITVIIDGHRFSIEIVRLHKLVALLIFKNWKCARLRDGDEIFSDIFFFF